MKKKQSGFGAVEALLVIIVLLIIGFIGYYVYHIHQTNKAGSAVSTTSSTTKKAASAQYLTVSEWGVRLPLGNDIVGTTYKLNSANTPQSIDLTVPNSECKPIYTMVRTTTKPSDPGIENIRHLGDYYYFLIGTNASSCFKGEQVGTEPAVGVKTKAVFSQIYNAFNNMIVVASP